MAERALKAKKRSTAPAERDAELFPEVEARRSSSSRRAPSSRRSSNRRVATPAVEASAVDARTLASAASSAPFARKSIPLGTVGGVALLCLGLGGLAAAPLFTSTASQPRASRVVAAISAPAASAAPMGRIGAPAVEADPMSAPTRSDARRAAPAHTAPAAAAPASSASAPRTELDTALESLVAAAKDRDPAAIDAVKESLARLVAGDPAAGFAAVMAALQAEQDEQVLAVLSTVLLDDALAGRPEVLASLTDMAREDELPARRAVAVRTIGNLPGGDAARVDLLAGMERADSDPSVREAAAVALGVVGDRSPGDVAAAAARSLAQAAASESDPRVRSMLLYAVRDTRSSEVADVLLDALAHDADPAPRLAAADMLADVAAAHRSRAVAALATQLAQETDPRVRESIVKSIVGAGRLAAIPVLEQARAGAGNLQPLIDDYLAGLTSGEDDLDKLEAIRSAREAARAR